MATTAEKKRALCRAIEDWVPKREATIKKLEEVADEIQSHWTEVNKVKMANSGVNVVSGAASMALGTSSPLPGAGIGSTIMTAVVEEGKKTTVSSLLEEAKNVLEHESDNYEKVIDILKEWWVFQRTDEDIMKLETTDPKGAQLLKVAFQIIISLFATYFSHVAGKAAAEAKQDSREDAATGAAKEDSLLQVICKSPLFKLIVRAVVIFLLFKLDSKVADVVVTAIAEVVLATLEIIVGDEGKVNLVKLINSKLAANVLHMINFNISLREGHQVYTEKESEQEKEVREKIKVLTREVNKIIEFYNHLTAIPKYH